ncbi:YkgJ family cysteine cluster protein [Bacillus sp. FJAT-49736]|uniref:YkgJ family cysteine cluster protein n=1 Tax=Bacillus sp. FJAT-49736 TaxID=2833582 RepID=UPI001BCA618A|nr:YkgJ family cysteine cluster protein [Bacillus sp. FJAT-49736]MBS4172196.1 YkgJ family cysteine cluster protein [Bacillus sp. FJAT-49736]
MEQLPCAGCRGLCCGPVAITEQEFRRIKKKIKSMPRKTRDELQNQMRFHGTCIFYDLDHDRCGIYSVRPKACNMFGYYKGMACFRKPELATKVPVFNEKTIGILSIDFTWSDFIK